MLLVSVLSPVTTAYIARNRATIDNITSMSNLVGCVWELLSDSLLVTYCDDAATLDQWRSYTKMMRGLKARPTRFLIYANAVPPREVLTDIAGVARGETWTVALISPLLAVRFAASTFSFVVKGFRFFAPDRVADALAHLGSDDAETKRAFSALARLRGKEISLSPPQ